MKKVRLLSLIILILITCTGCNVEYNINISKDTITESIIVNDYVTSSRTEQDILNHYNMWYPVYVNYIEKGETIELEDFSKKVSGIEYYEKEIKTITDGYKYTYKYNYPIDKYYDSYALATTFIETTVQDGLATLVLKSGKENLLCNYDYFESARVNITIDPEVYKLNYTNGKIINKNTYTWNLNRSNCDDSQIILTLDILHDYETTDEKIEKEDWSDYTIYIFCGILLLLILIGYFIFNKIKEKNSNFNEDD